MVADPDSPDPDDTRGIDYSYSGERAGSVYLYPVLVNERRVKHSSCIKATE